MEGDCNMLRTYGGWDKVSSVQMVKTDLRVYIYIEGRMTEFPDCLDTG